MSITDSLAERPTMRTAPRRWRLWIAGLILGVLAAACAGTAASTAPGDGTDETGGTESELPVSEAARSEEAAPASDSAGSIEPVGAAPDTTEPEPDPSAGIDGSAEAPPNDLLANAIAIDPAGLPFSAVVDTTSATSDADDEAVACPAPQSDASVWYSFTSDVDTRVTVSGDGSDFPVGISVVSSEPGPFELIECRPFAFDVDIEANTTYYFQLFDGDDPGSQGGQLVFTVEPIERPSTEGLDPLGEEFVQTVAEGTSVAYGAFMFAAVDGDGQAVVGTAGGDADGIAPTATDVFRIGSITKVFTSLTVLSLVDDGVVDLDDPAADHVTRVPVPTGVTVRDLLRHTSGIANVTETEDFFPALLDDPDRVWTPEEMVELVADEPAQSPPGGEFSYSNTNYIILGVLIEEVTGQPYHEVVRERLLDPLGLGSTYLAGYEDGPPVFHPFEYLGEADYDYTSIATAAWSAGAMVSSATDLDRLFTAVFDERVVSGRLIAQMLDGDDYGLGIELDSSEGPVGHSGGIPGYETFVRHSPELRLTAFLVSTDESVDTAWAKQELFAAFSALATG